MLSLLKKLPRISGKKILIILSSIVLLHLFVMYFYIRDNRQAWGAANRDAMIQKIINAIQLANATPKENRQSAIAALDDPNLIISLTESPTWDMRFEQISFWEINHQLRLRSEGAFAISIRMPDGKWLNAKATLDSHILISQLLLITLELIMAIAILISAWSIHTFTKPLAKFKQTAEQLGVDLHTKMSPIEYGPPIVRETSNAMYKMQQRIQDLINDRTKMLAAISHDLRTPITRMKLRLQLLKNPNASLYTKSINDLNEMEEMISQTLAFARQDANQEKRVHFDIFSLLATISTEMNDLNHHVAFDTPTQRVSFYGQPLALKRALTNLINNAVKYSKHVVLNLQEKGSTIVITVDDDGPGIPEKDIQQVFKPFYRGEHSRSRHTGGVGLGLATTLDIIRAHHGQITLTNKPQGKGLLATVTLPK